MNEKQVRSFLKNLTEQKAPTAEINLWPAIEANLSEIPLQTSKLIQSRGIKMNTRQPSILRLAATAVMAVLLSGVLFLTVTPQGQVIAQNVLRFFISLESNIMPGTSKTAHTWIDQTPGVAVETPTPYPTPQGPAFETTCGPFQAPRCTIDEIRELVPFPVYGLDKLPNGFIYLGATGGPDAVFLIYASETPGGWLTINEALVIGNSDPASWTVGADAVIQRMTIGSVAGEYVKGSYDGNHNPPVWNGDLDVQTLRWVDQGVAFSMQMTGKAPRIDQEGMVDLAASLTNGPLTASIRRLPGTATSTPEPFNFHPVYPLTLLEAEKKAEFTVLSPSRLPEALSFFGAAFDEKTKSVQLFYRYNKPDMPELTDGLSIREMLLPESGPCTLCGFDIGQYDGLPENARRWVGENATIETVQIGDATAQYVEGVWKGTECCGWVWESDPYMKQLRWQVNGKAFELSYMGIALEKEELITIANSLQ